MFTTQNEDCEVREHDGKQDVMQSKRPAGASSCRTREHGKKSVFSSLTEKSLQSF